MRDNEKCNISHGPYHQLERYSIFNTKCIKVIDTEGPGIGETFYGCHTAPNTRCCEYKNSHYNPK